MTNTFYDHWRDVPGSAWRWPDFSPAEIACRGTGRILLNEPALDRLQALRDALAKPLIVRSAYRSPEHNRAVGGAPASMHLEGAAFDIAMTNHDPEAFEAAARAVGFLGFGFYPRSNFMHIDLGPARQWGERFPARTTAFAEDAPPAREVLADSRTMKGGAAAGVATLGAAGVEVAQSVLAETQTAILPLVPYLDTLRWVFIAVALAGIAVTIYNDGCWRRRRVALVLATSLLSGCAKVSSDGRAVRTCPPVVDYSRAFQARAAEELNSFPDGSTIAETLSDYAVLADPAIPVRSAAISCRLRSRRVVLRAFSCQDPAFAGS